MDQPLLACFRQHDGNMPTLAAKETDRADRSRNCSREHRPQTLRLHDRGRHDDGRGAIPASRIRARSGEPSLIGLEHFRSSRKIGRGGETGPVNDMVHYTNPTRTSTLIFRDAQQV